MLNDAAVGPLVASVEIVAIANAWENKYAVEHGGTVADWLRELHPAQTLAWYKRRSDAVAALGKSVTARLHHEAAVWVLNNVPSNLFEGIKFEVNKLYRDNGSMPVTKTQIVKSGKALMEVTEKAKKPRACVNCTALEARVERLEKQIRRLGEEPVQ